MKGQQSSSPDLLPKKNAKWQADGIQMIFLGVH